VRYTLKLALVAQRAKLERSLRLTYYLSAPSEREERLQSSRTHVIEGIFFEKPGGGIIGGGYIPGPENVLEICLIASSYISLTNKPKKVKSRNKRRTEL